MTYQQFMLGGLMAAGFAMSALAHSGATGVVKERMDAMKGMQEAVKSITPMFSGQATYDADGVRAAAADIAGHAGDAMTSKFTEGTTGHPSEARPEIWSDWDDFEALADQLELTARGLGLAAENGLHGANGRMGGTSGMMGGNSSGMMGSGSGMMGSGSGAMGGTMPMAETMTAEQIGQMPADGAFAMMTQTCSGCHDRFRMEH